MVRFLAPSRVTQLIAYLLTYFMEQSPSWKANRFSASQEIPSTLWNRKVHYRSHKCQLPVPTLSQRDPVHTVTSYFLNNHLNIILPSTLGTPKWSLSFRVPHQYPVYAYPLPYTCYMPRPSNSSRFYHPNSIWWGVQIIQLPNTRTKEAGGHRSALPAAICRRFIWMGRREYQEIG